MFEVSIIMSVKNGYDSLSDTIVSVLNQTYKDFEFIIVDDGSTDNTYQLLCDYATKDGRIKVLKNDKNLGLTKSLNRAIKEASSEYIGRIDAGDKWYPEKLEKQMLYINEYPETVLIGTQAELIDVANGHIERTTYQTSNQDIKFAFIKGNNPFIHSSVVFKKVLPYNENAMHVEDYELWSELFFLGEFHILNEYLVKYDIDFSSISYKYKGYQILNKYYAYKYFLFNLNKRPLKDTINFKNRVFKIFQVYGDGGLDNFGTEYGKIYSKNMSGIKRRIVVVMLYMRYPKLFITRCLHVLLIHYGECRFKRDLRRLLV